jgi:hypothetical protein
VNFVEKSRRIPFVGRVANLLYDEILTGNQKAMVCALAGEAVNGKEDRRTIPRLRP